MNKNNKRDDFYDFLDFVFFCEVMENDEENNGTGVSGGKEGCYIATCVYGSYDSPEVWVLRHFRDKILRRNALGRVFIVLYYAISPTLVRLFGETRWFRRFWRGRLDRVVERLREM